MADMWLSRDMSGCGLYTLWISGEPELNHDGYYKYSNHGEHVSLLLVSIHPSKLPWDDLKLDRGECMKVAVYPDSVETPDDGQSKLILTEDKSIVTPHIDDIG